LRKVEQRSRIWSEKFAWSCLCLEEEEVEREKKKAGDADIEEMPLPRCCWRRSYVNELQNTVYGRQTPICISKMPLIVGLSLTEVHKGNSRNKEAKLQGRVDP
jgi:hypothetical protein